MAVSAACLRRSRQDFFGVADTGVVCAGWATANDKASETAAAAILRCPADAEAFAVTLSAALDA